MTLTLFATVKLARTVQFVLCIFSHFGTCAPKREARKNSEIHVTVRMCIQFHRLKYCRDVEINREKGDFSRAIFFSRASLAEPVPLGTDHRDPNLQRSVKAVRTIEPIGTIALADVELLDLSDLLSAG